MFLIHETSQSLSFSNAKLLTEIESLGVVQGCEDDLYMATAALA